MLCLLRHISNVETIVTCRLRATYSLHFLILFLKLTSEVKENIQDILFSKL
jgi:hypothetical protein